MTEPGEQFLLVGNGNVGQAVPPRAEHLGLEPADYVIKSDGTYITQADGSTELYDARPDFWNTENVTDGVRLAFVTLPSDQDQRELEIIERLRERDITVVTAAKGALANHFERLEPHLAKLGKSATVGGGVRVLPWLSERIDPRTRQIHAVVNGTLNYLMHGLSLGEPEHKVITRASEAGFAEPGATDHLEVWNGETVGDIPKKTAILWNTVIRPMVSPGDIILPSDIEQPALTQDDVSRLISDASRRRYILSMLREEDIKEEDDIIAGFKKELDSGWVIMGGFRSLLDNNLFEDLRLKDEWNGVVMTGGEAEGSRRDRRSDGVYTLAGPGAGPGPTANSMVQDARQLLRI